MVWVLELLAGVAHVILEAVVDGVRALRRRLRRR
jgi:hypothetical protein